MDQVDQQDLLVSVVYLECKDLLEEQDSKDHEAVMELLDRMDNKVFLASLVTLVSSVLLERVISVRVVITCICNKIKYLVRLNLIHL